MLNSTYRGEHAVERNLIYPNTIQEHFVDLTVQKVNSGPPNSTLTTFGYPISTPKNSTVGQRSTFQCVAGGTEVTSVDPYPPTQEIDYSKPHPADWGDIKKPVRLVNALSARPNCD